jgi:hypothetical protein
MQPVLPGFGSIRSTTSVQEVAMCETCSDTRPSASPAGSGPGRPLPADPPSRPITAVMQPGFDTSVAIRIVPATTPFPTQNGGGCAPRGDRNYTPPRPQLSDVLIGKLTEASGAVTTWLAKQPAHARLFINDPVTALQQAGVDLTRAEAKELARSHTAVRADAVLPPGAQLSELTVTATRRGKVSDGRPGRPVPNIPDPANPDPTNPEKPTGGAGGCGC